jgi:hypothetical protein
MGNAYILFGKPEVKKPLGRHRHRWKGVVIMNLKETVCVDVNCSHLAQDIANSRLLKRR